MISYKPNPRWAEYKDSEGTFKPRYPVKPCPVCNREPVFVKLIGDGKWGKIKWHAIDYCGSIGHETDSKYIGDCIALWQEEAHRLDREMNPSGRGYWQNVQYRKKLEKWEAKLEAMTPFERWWNNMFAKKPQPPELKPIERHYLQDKKEAFQNL